jgi:hypothetical protein
MKFHEYIGATMSLAPINWCNFASKNLLKC